MPSAIPTDRPLSEAEVRAIERPHPNLLKMYFLFAASTLIAFPFVFLPLFFKYRTLRYRFDDEGVSATWGVLFRREIYLTYRRIQDIHVNRNLFERWLGIGTVELQTASGSSDAELALEGMSDYAAVRDYLYGRMRGTRGEAPAAAGEQVSGGETVALLHAVRDELAATRRALERMGSPPVAGG